jgi:hypothetical protein
MGAVQEDKNKLSAAATTTCTTEPRDSYTNDKHAPYVTVALYIH